MKQIYAMMVALMAVCVPHANALDLGGLQKAGKIVKDVSDVAQVMAITDAQEMQIGRENHPYIVAQFGGEASNPALKSYIQRVGNKLVAVSDRKGLTYHYTVLNSEVVNAFALPGGYVYVTRGMLKTLQDESELAAVLGHELTHVTHKHGIKKIQTAMVAEKASGYAAGAGAKAIPPAVMNEIRNITLNFALSGYGRAQETDADKTGVIFSNKAGYDPNGAVRVMEHLGKLGKSPKGLAAMMASHPDTGKRISDLKAHIKTLSPQGKTTNQAGYAKLAH